MWNTDYLMMICIPLAKERRKEVDKEGIPEEVQGVEIQMQADQGGGEIKRKKI